jgi:hypothetical protein
MWSQLLQEMIPSKKWYCFSSAISRLQRTKEQLKLERKASAMEVPLHPVALILTGRMSAAYITSSGTWVQK